MGSHGVGKSAIARRFLKNSFSESYQPTVEETYSTVLQTLTGSCIRLVLTDTAGLHHFPAMRELRMRTGDAFLLVFSFDSQESFQEALRLHKKLKQVRGDLFDDQAVIFVGNKLDLLLWPSTGSNPPQNVRPEKDVHQKGLRVNGGMSVAQTAAAIYQQAESTLSQKPSSRYITTSARIGHNVLELYHLILWPILHASAQPKSNQDTRKPGFSEDGMARRKISAVKFAPKRVVWPWKQISSMRSRVLWHADRHLPRSISETLMPWSSPPAVNCFPIPIFGSLSLTLNIGIRRSSIWIFVIGDVPHAILGSDFHAEFDLLVDCRRARLLNRTTDLPVCGLTPFIAPTNLSVLDADIVSPFRELLLRHPNIINPQFRSGEVQNHVLHHICTSGPLELTGEALTALERIKNSVVDATLLTHPVPEAQLSLMADASAVAVGAVLQQNLAGSTRLLDFFSQKLLPAETHHSTFGRELLAIYLAGKHFRHFLGGRDFTVFTEHTPLTVALRSHSDKYNSSGNRPS
nr:unnamed protein product [Spirometra erinaceieuropaei]